MPSNMNPNNIDEMIKESSEEIVKVKDEKFKGDPDILEYLEREYPAEKYNADFCQYRYKFGSLYNINFWEKIYKNGCGLASNRIFRRMIFNVTMTPDGPLVKIDTDEGEFKG